MKRETDFRLFGIFGFPLSHTLSPAMQEAAFSALGLKAYYTVFELDLPRFHRAMKHLGCFLPEGFNVTVPYKEKVIPYLDRLTPKAKAIGAVNTVFRDRGRWAGTNTDVDGFLISLKKDARFRPRGKKVLILGAGGGARAVCYGLASEGALLVMMTDLYLEKAEKIIRDFRPLFPKTRFVKIACDAENLQKALADVHLVVNATAVGLKPSDPVLLQPSWIPKGKAKKKMLFYDLIYRPARTPFLKIAARRGHRISNGLGMLLYQGAYAFEHWTRKKAPVSVMRKALDRALKEQK